MQTISPVSSQPNAIVLYDGQCPLCRRSVAVLQRLDWLKSFNYQDARKVDELPESKVPLQPARLLEEMHVLTPDRKRVYAGFKAFRWIALRVPLLWPLLPLMYFPGIPALGQRIYLWVAKNRFNLVPCHNGQCAIPLKRK
jgi:predicted DCC family thiol-disulfide oxidoreductase YuxK